MASTRPPRRSAVTPSPESVEALSGSREAEKLIPARRVDPVTHRAAGAREYPHKVGFYCSPEQAARLRAVYLHTRDLTGATSLTGFLRDTVEQRLAELEAEHNGGQPWEPVYPGGIGTGKPVGV